jgi:tRNA(Arg) A34 adenosine deaminase TadA
MTCTRRIFVLAALAATATRADAAPNEFVAAALRMKEQAVAADDQAYGAVVVRNSEIVGWGPSRVRQNGEWAGHAEREALRDAQRRLAREDLSDCVMYSTSRPCGACERAAAQAKLARMYYGPDATDAGAPR